MYKFILIPAAVSTLLATSALAQTAVGNTSNSVKGPVGATVGNTVGSSVGGVVDSTVNDPSKAPLMSGAMTDGEPLEKNGASSKMMNWSTENEYWRGHYSSRPYYEKERGYSVYEPAYQYGFDAYNEYGGKRYEDLDDARLKAGWERAHANTGMSWEQARGASRDAYERLYNLQLNSTSVK